MKELPQNVTSYGRTKSFSQDTVPHALLNDHKTKAGTWAKIHIEKGALTYIIGKDEVHHLTPDSPHGIIEPEQLHKVQLHDEATFFVEFFK